MHPDQPKRLLRRFFAGLTEYAFQTRLGVADPHRQRPRHLPLRTGTSIS